MLLSALPCLIQTGDKDADLTQELIQPFAGLTTLPVRLNPDGAIGTEDEDTRIASNTSTGIPVDPGDSKHWITWAILPIAHPCDILPEEDAHFGLRGIKTQS